MQVVPRVTPVALPGTIKHVEFEGMPYGYTWSVHLIDEYLTYTVLDKSIRRLGAPLSFSCNIS